MAEMPRAALNQAESRQTSLKGGVCRFLIVAAYLAIIPAMVLGPMVLAAWLSVSTHEFGPWDPRYLLLVRGGDVARLGTVEPMSGSVRYAASGHDGNSPARVYVEFSTTLRPEQVIEIYETRCVAIGLAVRRMPPDGEELRLGCDGKTSEIGIGAQGSQNTTRVTIGGWEY